MSISLPSLDKYSFTKGQSKENYTDCTAQRKTDGKVFSAMIFHQSAIQNTPFLQSFRGIYELQGSISHPQIQKIVDVAYSSDFFSIILEKPDSTAFDLISEGKPISEDLAADVFCCLVDAVRCIHENSIAHLDIRLENLFQINGNFKLGYFLRAKLVTDFEDNRAAYGSLHYSAPELLSQGSCDLFKADVWACGVVLYAMLHGKLPYGNDSNSRKLEDQIKSGPPKFTNVPNPELAELLQSILNPSPVERPTIQAVCMSKWVASARNRILPSPATEQSLSAPCSGQSLPTRFSFDQKESVDESPLRRMSCASSNLASPVASIDSPLEASEAKKVIRAAYGNSAQILNDGSLQVSFSEPFSVVLKVTFGPSQMNHSTLDVCSLACAKVPDFYEAVEVLRKKVN